MQRRARDSNPQPLAGRLISNQVASQFAYPPEFPSYLLCQQLRGKRYYGGCLASFGLLGPGRENRISRIFASCTTGVIDTFGCWSGQEAWIYGRVTPAVAVVGNSPAGYVREKRLACSGLGRRYSRTVRGSLEFRGRARMTDLLESARRRAALHEGTGNGPGYLSNRDTSIQR